MYILASDFYEKKINKYLKLQIRILASRNKSDDCLYLYIINLENWRLKSGFSILNIRY